LVAALHAAAAAGPLPVELTVDAELDRPSQSQALPRGVAAALYFCCVEALQNAAKHAAATRVTLHLARTAEGWIEVTVTDDGRGLPPDTGTGLGLANMRDRAEAFGGEVRVSSPAGSGAGHGVEVSVRIPVPDRDGP
jgi:signal transduction histidine kinase